GQLLPESAQAREHREFGLAQHILEVDFAALCRDRPRPPIVEAHADRPRAVGPIHDKLAIDRQNPMSSKKAVQLGGGSVSGVDRDREESQLHRSSKTKSDHPQTRRSLAASGSRPPARSAPRACLDPLSLRPLGSRPELGRSETPGSRSGPPGRSGPGTRRGRPARRRSTTGRVPARSCGCCFSRQPPESTPSSSSNPTPLLPPYQAIVSSTGALFSPKIRISPA